MEQKTELRYSKVRSVNSLTRGTKKSAGIDFYVPEFNEQFMKDLIKVNPNPGMTFQDSYSYVILKNGNDRGMILLAPHARLLIPAGIKIEGNIEIASVFKNKSGISTKKGLDILACVIDEDYQGEVHISLVNTSPFIVGIQESEKITQLLEYKTQYSDLVEVPIEELYSEESERGEGGFGHTDEKDDKESNENQTTQEVND